MTATAADLLPREAGTFEKAVALALTDVLPVPLRTVLNPAQTPAAFLPFLAAQESVDLWYEDWSDDRKRAMIAEAVSLASRKGLRIGAVRFLSYVDATLVDAVAYPSPFIMNYSIVGRTPIGLKPFKANYLIRVDTTLERHAFVIGRSANGVDFLKRPSREKFDRCLAALRVAKGPETEIRVDFGYLRPLQIEDGPVLDDDLYALGDYVARNATPNPAQIWTGTNRLDFSDINNSGYAAAIFEDV
jgi:P2-related tail formation protein